MAPVSLVFLLLCFFYSPVALASEQETATICYLSMNNEKEFELMHSFADKLNESAESKVKIIVKEFQSAGDNPEKSFEKMIASGTKCDGLVISGHHTGAFGGKRAWGSLSLAKIEDLSCEDENLDWFNDVKALWLQGCRTLGVAEVSRADLWSLFR